MKLINNNKLKYDYYSCGAVVFMSDLAFYEYSTYFRRVYCRFGLSNGVIVLVGGFPFVVHHGQMEAMGKVRDILNFELSMLRMPYTDFA